MTFFHPLRLVFAGSATADQSSHVPLAAFGPICMAKGIFAPIHQHVLIRQKTIDYRPTDKLIFVVLGILSGSRAFYDINRTLRTDIPLLRAFGYDRCAEQSVIADTLDACQADNVTQLEVALKEIFAAQNLLQSHLQEAMATEKKVTLDIDLSGLSASKRAQGSTKGYFAGKRNTYGRQLARVVSPVTQEIVTESLYPGNTLSMQAFKEMLNKMEQTLSIENKAQRQSIRLRIDGGFGTDENLNYALWKGYHLLAKMFHGKRAKKLAQSVTEWFPAPTPHQQRNGENPTREVGWVSTPHRYGRKTRQFAIRTPNPKRKGGFCYRVIVTTDMDANLFALVSDYDQRSGVPESTFCQDYQGLGLRKRTKANFIAQQMLVLLSQLAHNLCQWFKHWLVTGLKQKAIAQQMAIEMGKEKLGWLDTKDRDDSAHQLRATIETVAANGIQRFVGQILAISGQVRIAGGKLGKLLLNHRHPMISRIWLAFQVLLEPYRIQVVLTKT